MPKDKRIDAYITKSAIFAQPILTHLRTLVHKGCPDVVETIKWGFPNFDYKGVFCSMAAFKQHCSFGFWKYSLIKDPKGLLSTRNEGGAMGNLGLITSLKDLPVDKILLDFIKQAVVLNDLGVKRPTKVTPKGSKTIATPDYLKKAFKKNKKAHDIFENFAYSHRKEYIQWFDEAKTEETRNRRIAQAITWISEGRGRNWKYEEK